MASPSDEFVETPGVPDSEDYRALLEDYSNPSASSKTEVLQGHVLSVSAKEVIVDIGRKLEGLVPIEQFAVLDGQVAAVKPGDTIEVMLEQESGLIDGYLPLSYEKAHRRQVWERVEQAAAAQTPLTGRIVGRTKGGLEIDIGIKAFLPSSQIEVRPVHNLDGYLGRELEVQIIKINRHRGNAVVSRRVLIEHQFEDRKVQVLDRIFEGAEVTGTVKNLTEYGAFVDLGGIDGLLHVSDLSYGNVVHPSAVIQVGNQVTAKVLKFDREKERISLGLKQMYPDPWSTIDVRYPLQGHVIGRVVSVTDYGAFIELEPGVEGLIHISEMTWSRRMKHPAKVVRPGDEVEAVVLEIKPKERRISLGIKQLEADPWTTVAERYSIGSVVEGRVRKLAEFGAFIEIEEGVDGLVHISDMSWTARIKHPSELVKKGQIVQAVILNIDAANRRLSLGIKQLQPDAWETFFRAHQVGNSVRGRVCRAAEFGVFVELLPGVEGLCHRSEIPGDLVRRRSSVPEEFVPLSVGEEFDFKVIKINEAQKRIGLSLRAIAEEEERSRLQDYQRQAVAATSTVGDVLNQYRSEDTPFSRDEQA